MITIISLFFQVILIEPCYEPYMELARLAGASVKYVPLIPVCNPACCQAKSRDRRVPNFKSFTHHFLT